jgi:hypothetical protein
VFVGGDTAHSAFGAAGGSPVTVLMIRLPMQTGHVLAVSVELSRQSENIPVPQQTGHACHPAGTLRSVTFGLLPCGV